MSCQCKDCSSKNCNEASTTSTPFVSAPSSPRKSSILLANDTQSAYGSYNAISACEFESAAPSDFDFSDCILEPGSPLLYTSITSTMSSAEDLFHNGQIKPLNTRFSSCMCCNYEAQCGGFRDFSTLDVPHTYDASCHQCAACKGASMSRNMKHHGTSQTSRRQGQMKLTSSADSALDQWKKGVDRKKGKGNARHDEHAHLDVGTRVTQISSLPLAYYSKRTATSAHYHRRARSLSPLRVFHIDDMIQPRPSFEISELYTHMSSRAEVSDVGIIRPRRRRSRKSWTLKELLNFGDNKVHDKRPHQLDGKAGPVDQLDSAIVEQRADLRNDRDKGSLAEGNLHSKSSAHHLTEGGLLLSSPWNLQRDRVFKRVELYHSKEAYIEGPKKHNSVSYKKGLLSCLGFTSKLSSVKGLHAMHFNAG